MDFVEEIKLAQQRVEDLREAQREEARRYREEVLRAEAAKRVAQAEELAAEWLPGLPKTLTDRVYSYAWDMGHSAGFNEVATYYGDVAELVFEAYGMGQHNE
jgi:hypothetical protein